MVSRAGYYQEESSGYKVFIPKPLPPEPPINYDNELLELLSEANQSLGKLEGLAEVIPNPDHFITMFIKKEALLSSQIEGTQASFSDLIISESKKKSIISPEVQEVMNYIKALYYGLERVNDLPVSLRLLKEIHDILLKDTRGSNRNRGSFRKTQNWIGPLGSTIMDADFIPPPVNVMSTALGEFEHYYHYGTEPALIKCGLLHAQFETIHPFIDGNGRIGRLLVTFFLCEQKVLERPLLYLSFYFKKNRMKYYEMLMNVRNKGEWESWLKFFLQGIIEVSQLAVDTAKRILKLQDYHREIIRNKSNSMHSFGLYDYLLYKPIISVRSVAKELGVTYTTANRLTESFVAIGILSEITKRARNREFVYEEYLNVLSEGTTPL